MNRSKNIEQLQNQTFDVCIIGAGASGTGCALDAALRGMKVALIDKTDFAAETSSRSTKLIHGGVRYLEQAFKNFDFAQLKQVKHGLEERHIVMRNAPHLAQPLALITPVFSWFEGMYFTIGLSIYGLFAKGDPLPPAQWLNKKATLARMPTLTPRIHSSVMYYDGQHDDARYCLALAQSAHEAGASVVNHLEIKSFSKNADGKLSTAQVRDTLTGKEFEIQSKLFINCAGPYADAIRRMASPEVTPRLRPSKGVHIILPHEVLKSQDAMLIPKTKDGRVVFVIPFEGEVMVGTTDDEYRDLDKEPILEEKEVDFLLETLEPFLAKTPTRSQVKAGFGGLRPLIGVTDSKATKKLVRDHEVEHDLNSNLISLLGGKWTTYRLMAKDTIDLVAELLQNTAPCQTHDHLLMGAEGYRFEDWETLQKQYNLAEDTAKHLVTKYGNKAEEVAKIAKRAKEGPEMAEKLHPKYPFIQAEVIYQARHEMACTVRDVLARRIRLELMDWQAAQEVVYLVGAWLAVELDWTGPELERQMDEYQNQLDQFMQRAAVETPSA
ncbi:MAG: FAD-dependent oxidoreductase [Cytophagia bacterium]|nr:MAG: FAD-dependent oxidoreductase [Runella sp.]TAG22716.1 MAG: FAD-dependent oxidoreductase [Cytophagales bacterium]TAG41816.1 MAG: FAD-dependent oxidoreductase [Cytophagia bacterium]TAG71515.1 MAG: FAD-dependent oxidoreductase [Runella slithyformis]TAG83539.1 MAG: FAD-dependent oxidoreductase [Cytophagales bacterium]